MTINLNAIYYIKISVHNKKKWIFITTRYHAEHYAAQ